MKVAFSVWDDRIAPVFDAARRLCVVEFDDNRIVREIHKDLSRSSPASNAAWLAEQGVQTLVCGAISCRVQAVVAAYGIEVLPFVTGELKEIISAWLDGSLKRGRFAMPGCHGRRRMLRVRRLPNEAGLMTRRPEIGATCACVCRVCGHEEPYHRGRPCVERQCPKCGTEMAPTKGGTAL